MCCSCPPVAQRLPAHAHLAAGTAQTPQPPTPSKYTLDQRPPAGTCDPRRRPTRHEKGRRRSGAGLSRWGGGGHGLHFVNAARGAFTMRAIDPASPAWVTTAQPSNFVSLRPELAFCPHGQQACNSYGVLAYSEQDTCLDPGQRRELVFVPRSALVSAKMDQQPNTVDWLARVRPFCWLGK